MALRRMSYRAARWGLLGVGVVILLIIAAVVYARRVETTEVIATLLFIPVFIALVLWGWRGGLGAGILAAGTYAWLRVPAIEAVGLERFIGLLISRSVAYVAFGTIGGWAAKQVQGSLRKLDLYDQIDDATGLYNARFFMEDTDLEMSRAKRYQTVFSVASVDVPQAALAALSGRKTRRLLRDLGRGLRDSIRTVDRATHADDGIHHRFTVILPETGPEGARIFTNRLSDRIAAQLTERGVTGGKDRLQTSVLTHPDDEGSLHRLRDEFSAIDRAEHPTAPDRPERPPAPDAA